MDSTWSPSNDERRNFITDILKMLRDAITIELTTIPLYLYSIYSISKKEEGGTKARAKISVVVHQEMLHLALAGNLLTSIESGPHLYRAGFLPTYGGPEDTILYSEIPLTLEKCGKDNLECFLKIEAPYQPPPKLTSDEESANVGLHMQPVRALEGYNSIGEFYTKLEEMIKQCGQSGYAITFKNKDLQFSPTEFFADKMTQVTDQESAHHALKIIIDQGEGSVGVEDAHYQMFLELYQNRTDWTCWPVPTSPNTEMYKAKPVLYQLALASDAAYCYLLITIQKTWQVDNPVYRRGLITNIHSIMINIITPIAEFMVEEPFDLEKGLNGAPAFQFYKTDAGDDLSKVDEAAKELQEAIKLHLENAIKEVADVKKKEALNVIKFSAERISWPIV